MLIFLINKQSNNILFNLLFYLIDSCCKHLIHNYFVTS
uniref:Uncharacterized protein n=1 Tax=Rhizophora mucronata TaxID=61149 RepID=A0A2P2PSA0_RHIMU